MESFEYFGELPLETQLQILEQNPEMLIRYRQVSPLYRSALSDEYIRRYCDLPISQKEIIDYIDFGLTNRAFGYLHFTQLPYKGMLSYGFVMLGYDETFDDQKGYTALRLSAGYDKSYITVIFNTFSNIMWDINKSNIKLDLLSLYYILRKRLGCMNINPGYAKQRIMVL